MSIHEPNDGKNIYLLLETHSVTETRLSISVITPRRLNMLCHNILHTTRRRKADWIGHILLRNCSLKHGIGGKIEERMCREDEKEDVSSCCVTLRKREDTGN
jgi:hypothetical protein